MSNVAKKQKLNHESQNRKSLLLVNVLDFKSQEDRSWFWDFVSGIFQSPDLDYSQFEHIENRRTPQQMRRNGFY